MPDVFIWIVLGCAYLSTWIFIPYVLLKRSAHPSAAVAWILAIVFMPFVGALVCAVFGTTRWERRSEDKRSATAHIDQRVPPPANAFLLSEDALKPWHSLARIARGITGMPVLTGNKIELSADTKRSFERMEEIINAAERWIHVEFYIWKNDETGIRIRDLLVQKAKDGLQVRFLYDGFGSMQLSRHFLKPLRDAGVSTAPFTPGIHFWHILTLNLRNHRKIIVTDRLEAFTGGMNIGDEYVRPTKYYGHWRDTQLLLRGPVASQFQTVFAQDWFYATGEELTREEFNPESISRGDIPAQVVADGPDNDVDTFQLLAVAALGQAQRCVTMSTPYFAPPDGLATALETAARRGVRVRLMIAQRGNFTWTLYAGRSFYEPLLAAGVEIYEYQRGLFHPKTLSVDGEWSLVGTANWDFRSLILNFEVGLSMFDPQVARDLDAHFEKDCQYAEKIDPQAWRERSRSTRLKEQFWRLFAPTL